MEIFNGVDILDIKRIDKIYKKFGERFEKKILSNQEIILLKKKNINILERWQEYFPLKNLWVKQLVQEFQKM